MSKNLLLSLLILFVSGKSYSQNVDQNFQDIQWAHYNANINIFLGDGIGSAIKGGVDADYVNDRLGIQDFAFHSVKGMMIETISVVNFNREANKKHFRLKFANGEEANFPEVIMYLADNYASYYSAPDLNRPYLPNELAQLKDSCNLKDAKRVVFKEYWFYDVRDQKMKSYLRGMGIIADSEPSNKQVLWVDMRYFDVEVFNRVNVIREDGASQSFMDYMNVRPFVMEDVKWSYSRTFDQTKYDTYNAEIDVYFELCMLQNQIDLDKHILKLKKGKPVKTKLFSGMLNGDTLEGKWIFKYDNGKTRAEFNFEKGVPKGKYNLFDINGKLREEGLLNGFLKEGENNLYFPKGNKKASKNYVNGKLNGDLVLYFENEKTHSKFSYENNFVQGEYIAYNFDESVKLKGTFKNGVIVNEWYYNLPINSLMCGYLQDELPVIGEVTGIESTCMDDCTATFKYLFEQKEDINCFNNVCILPKRLGDIK